MLLMKISRHTKLKFDINESLTAFLSRTHFCEFVDAHCPFIHWLSLPEIQRLETSSAQNPGTPNSRWLILILFLLEQIQFGKTTSLLSLPLSSHPLKFYHHHHHHHQPRNIVFFGLSIIKKIKTEEGSCFFANSIPLNRKELVFFFFNS